jgi:shikimate dehydrogenase
VRHRNNIESMDSAINATTGLAALYGHPVGHSLSPLFMNHAMQLLGLNCRYLAFDIEPDRLRDAITSVRTLDMEGVNITIPFKQAAVRYLDNLDEDALHIEAVNCIYKRGVRLIGTNTDHAGFVQPLKERGYGLGGAEALLLGCGGAARAVVYALWKEGIRKIHLLNRTPHNARNFIRWCNKSFKALEIGYLGNLSTAPKETAHECSFIINTTPVGMYPSEGGCPLPPDFDLHKGQVVYDLVYNPEATILLQRASASGAETVKGLEMLILQGMHSLSLWFPERSEEIASLSGSVLEFARRALKRKAFKVTP